MNSWDPHWALTWRCMAFPLSQLLPHPSSSRMLVLSIAASSPALLPSFSRTLLPVRGFRAPNLSLAARGNGGSEVSSEGGWHLLSASSSLVEWGPLEAWPAGHHLRYFPQLAMWPRLLGQMLIPSGPSRSFCCYPCVGPPGDI